jgi:hypothetical protein
VFFAEAIMRPITSAARVERKPAPRRMASLEPPSSRSAGRVLFRTMPMTAPTKIAAKEARNATVELMVSSLCHGAGGLFTA